MTLMPRSTFLALGALAIASILVLASNALGPHPLLAGAALAIASALILAFVRLDPLSFILLFLFLQSQGGSLLGGTFIESGAYVLEQNRYGFPTGSTARAAAFLFIFILFGTLFLRRMGVGLDAQLHELRIRPHFRFVVYTAASFILLVCIAALIFNGSPLLNATDRFTYWRTNSIPLLQPVHNQISTAVFLVGLCVANARRRPETMLAYSIFVVSVAYFVFQGEKFTALLHVTYGFALPIWVTAFAQTRKRPRLSRFLGAGALLGGLLTGLILFQYSTARWGTSPTTMLAQRIALQGHVWWGMDERFRADGLLVEPAEQIRREIAAMLGQGSQQEAPVGMALLMRTVAPAELVERYERQGIRFTLGYPAIGLYLGGYWVIVTMQVAAALLFALVARYLAVSILLRRPLDATVGYKLLYEIYRPFTIGNLHEVFSWQVMLYVFAAATLGIARAVHRQGPASAEPRS